MSYQFVQLLDFVLVAFDGTILRLDGFFVLKDCAIAIIHCLFELLDQLLQLGRLQCMLQLLLGFGRLRFSLQIDFGGGFLFEQFVVPLDMVFLAFSDLLHVSLFQSLDRLIRGLSLLSLELHLLYQLRVNLFRFLFHNLSLSISNELLPCQLLQQMDVHLFGIFVFLFLPFSNLPPQL